MLDATPSAPSKDRGRAEQLRMVVHASLSLSLLYLAVPDPLPLLGLPKGPAAIAFALLVSVVEAWRVHSGWTFFLFRDYEAHRPAAYYWLGLGCILGLVFFPTRFAILTILGVCFVDPIINTVRPRAGRALAGAAGASAWAAVAFAAVLLAPLPVPLWLVPVGALAAVAGEAPRSRFIDDDFLMNMVPLAALTVVARALGA